MPADPNIFNPLLQPRPTALDYAQQYSQTVGAANQNKLQGVALRQAEQAEQERNALRGYLSGGADLTSAQGIAGGYAAAPTQFGPIAKAFQDRLTSQAQANKDNAQAEHFGAQSAQIGADVKWKLADRHAQQLAFVQTPEDAVSWIDEGIREGSLPMAGRERAIAQLQQGGVDAWKQMAQQGAVSALEKFKQDADNYRAQLQAQTSTANNAATNATSRANNAATQAGENARAKLSRETQLKLGGYDANGNLLDLGLGAPGAPAAPGAAPTAPAASPLKGLVDAIGTYQSPESIALSRTPPAMKAQVLAAVKQQYPDYDPMFYTERQAGIHSFAPNGNNGKTVQALNVAVDHLQQFRGLADALNNNDNQTFNKVANAISAWSGSPAPTNFEAAKNIVMDEVTKGVIGAAGGQGDREKMAAVVSSANSPAQLAGALDTVTHLMGGRLVGVEQSYSASTGRKDFSTKYLTENARAALEKSSGKPAAASGWKIEEVK